MMFVCVALASHGFGQSPRACRKARTTGYAASREEAIVEFKITVETRLICAAI
jgi:hypothetical protein